MDDRPETPRLPPRQTTTAGDDRIPARDAAPHGELDDVVRRAIRAERGRLRMTRARLAEVSGLTPQTVAGIETGERRVRVVDLVVLCRALGTPLSGLLRDAPTDDLVALGLQGTDAGAGGRCPWWL